MIASEEVGIAEFRPRGSTGPAHPLVGAGHVSAIYAHKLSGLNAE